MENIDIIVLSTITTTLFVVFGIFTYRELRNIDLRRNTNQEHSPRANLVRFVGRLFDESSNSKINARQQAAIYYSVKRTIADMESDGVYFPKEVKEELEQKKEHLICNYSDLPSVMSYLEEEEFYNGHS